MIICIQHLVKFCLFILKILSKNQFLASSKGRNPVANLQKMMFYNPNVDLVHDYVFTKFGKILSIHSQDIEQKPVSDVNNGCNSVANLRQMMLYNPNIDLINDNV